MNLSAGRFPGTFATVSFGSVFVAASEFILKFCPSVRPALVTVGGETVCQKLHRRPWQLVDVSLLE